MSLTTHKHITSVHRDPWLGAVCRKGFLSYSTLNHGGFHLASLILSCRGKKDKCQSHGGARGNVVGCPKVRIHPLGTTNNFTKFHSNPALSFTCWTKASVSENHSVTVFVSANRAAAAQVEPQLCDTMICLHQSVWTAAFSPHALPSRPLLMSHVVWCCSYRELYEDKI